ncbi:hypothetical protein IFM89_037143 [Coptis chinensis]|uniref:CWZF3/5/7 THD domain-containing protein n=1 Tax=Coptis chinensis TaxID=261450 RepID=A0A835HQ18_9MAGN|nr:hypothetical protein IFM89_037143 [Coptis chinensis]
MENGRFGHSERSSSNTNSLRLGTSSAVSNVQVSSPTRLRSRRKKALMRFELKSPENIGNDRPNNFSQSLHNRALDLKDIDCMPLNPLDYMPDALRRQSLASDKLHEHKLNGRSNDWKSGGHVKLPPSENQENADGISHISPPAYPMNTLLKHAKGDTINSISQAKAAASEIVNAQKSTYTQPCTLARIQAREADIRALFYLTRALDKKTQDVNSAMEASRKAQNAFAVASASLEESRYEGISSVKRVLDFNFHDVQGLLRLVRLAMEDCNGGYEGRSRGGSLSVPPYDTSEKGLVSLT